MRLEIPLNRAFSFFRSFAGLRFSQLALVWLSTQAVHCASAATITWTGAASVYWTNSANWSPAQVPTPADTAVINSGNVTFAPNAAAGTLNFNGGTITGPGKEPANRLAEVE